VIIFGARSTKRVVDTGVFACPRCGADRDFRRLRVRRWGHVFFIPLIPFGSPDEVVQCGTCRACFPPEVLSIPTASTLLADLEQVVQLVAMTAVTASDTDRPLRADVARRVLADRGWSGEHVASTVEWAMHADARQASEMHGQLCRRMAQLAPSLEHAGIEPIVMAYGSIMAADGTFDDRRAAMVAELGRAAGLSAAHAQGIVAAVEASTRPA
jgi:hypothetical protein